MNVDFNNLRMQAVDSYNELISILNRNQYGTVAGFHIELPPADLSEVLKQLKLCISAIAYCKDESAGIESLKDFKLKSFTVSKDGKNCECGGKVKYQDQEGYVCDSCGETKLLMP